jgi:hypothetical protein
MVPTVLKYKSWKTNEAMDLTDLGAGSDQRERNCVYLKTEITYLPCKCHVAQAVYYYILTSNFLSKYMWFGFILCPGSCWHTARLEIIKCHNGYADHCTQRRSKLKLSLVIGFQRQNSAFSQVLKFILELRKATNIHFRFHVFRYKFRHFADFTGCHSAVALEGGSSRAG